jgi:hypothetical protein
VIQNIGLVVAEVTDGIFAEVRIVEGEDFQVGEPVQIEYLLETADLITCNVQVSEINESVQACLDGIDLVASDPQLLQTREPIQILDCIDFVIADP